LSNKPAARTTPFVLLPRFVRFLPFAHSTIS
jgi:hypothetical protein